MSSPAVRVRVRVTHLFPDDEFPCGDGQRARDQRAAKERGLDELAQELGDAPATQDAGQDRIGWQG